MSSDKKCVFCLKPQPNIETASKLDSKPADATVSHRSISVFPAGSWVCDTCMVRNKPDVFKCLVCYTAKPGTGVTSSTTLPPPAEVSSVLSAASSASSTTTTTLAGTPATLFGFKEPEVRWECEDQKWLEDEECEDLEWWGDEEFEDQKCVASQSAKPESKVESKGCSSSFGIQSDSSDSSSDSRFGGLVFGKLLVADTKPAAPKYVESATTEPTQVMPTLTFTKTINKDTSVSSGALLFSAANEAKNLTPSFGFSSGKQGPSKDLPKPSFAFVKPSATDPPKPSFTLGQSIAAPAPNGNPSPFASPAFGAKLSFIPVLSQQPNPAPTFGSAAASTGQGFVSPSQSVAHKPLQTASLTQSSTSAHLSGFSDKFKAPVGSWSCGTCLVQNKSSDKKCVACQSSQPNTDSKSDSKPADATTSLSSLFAPPAGSWDCDTCLVRNKPDVVKCVDCDTAKPGTSVKSSMKLPPLAEVSSGLSAASFASSTTTTTTLTGTGLLGFGDKFKKPEGSWDCDVCMVQNKARDVKCVACQSAKPGAVAAAVPTPAPASPPAPLLGFGDKFKKPEGSWECKVCCVQNKAVDQTCLACQSAKPESKVESKDLSSDSSSDSGSDSSSDSRFGGLVFGKLLVADTKPAAPKYVESATTEPTQLLLPMATHPPLHPLHSEPN
ncbi:uncharacterized protein [Paramisgurnus dabryanus]|uniref:uncharacterized protein isoform X2 n=1 Tax=Paramisgurnus dabryanus TaxID=90735 RepID=UPI0031F3FE63